MKEEIAMIPFVAHESAMNRMERANKRLWILVIILILAFTTYVLVPSQIVEETSQDVSEVTDSQINQSIGE